MVGLLVPLAALERGATPAFVGLLVSLAYALPFLLAMPIGGLADRIDSRWLLLAAALSMALIPALTSAFLSLPALVVAQVFFGMNHLVFVLAAQRLVSGLGTGSVGERNFGWFTTFQSAAQLIGALAAGILLDLFAAPTAFLISGLVALFAVRTTFLLPASHPHRARGERRPAIRPFGGPGELKGLFENYGVRLAILVSCGVLVVGAVRQSFLPVYLDSLAFPATTIGFLISVRGLSSMLVRPFMPAIVRSLGGRSWTLLTTVVVLAVGIGMTAFIETIVPLFIASVLVGISSGISQPLSVVTVADHVPKEKVGFALGFRLTGNRLAQTLAPVTVGLIAEAAGVRWSFIVAAAALLVTAPLVLLWRGGFEAAEIRLAELRRAPAD